jgi:hypothetical protein
LYADLNSGLTARAKKKKISRGELESLLVTAPKTGPAYPIPGSGLSHVAIRYRHNFKFTD